MFMTPSQIVTFASLLQPQNAHLPMLTTLPGIATLVRPLQYSNANSPMLLTLLGNVTLVMPLHPLNADSPMLVTGRRLPDTEIAGGMFRAPLKAAVCPVMVTWPLLALYKSPSLVDPVTS
jgi:hypothetical protein